MIMNTLLWTIQGFLAIVFVYSGMMKSSQKREKLVNIGQTGVANLSYPIIRLIGGAEILGAIGITIPWATGILPLLTPVSAIGFAIIMVLAIPIHYRRAEYKSVAFNGLLLMLSIFIAYMRYVEM
jgi:uncharacterized membrane protein YphA (DoxX/SURF4 family)